MPGYRQPMWLSPWRRVGLLLVGIGLVALTTVGTSDSSASSVMLAYAITGCVMLFFSLVGSLPNVVFKEWGLKWPKQSRGKKRDADVRVLPQPSRPRVAVASALIALPEAKPATAHQEVPEDLPESVPLSSVLPFPGPRNPYIPEPRSHDPRHAVRR